MIRLLLTALVVVAWVPHLQAARPTVFFNRDVRPILARHCFRCHGPDKGQREADLRLDQEAGIRRAFAGGKLTGSKAWRRLRSSDADEVMPPKSVTRRPTASELQTIGLWIQQGAKWEGHWSFLAPRKPSVPAVSQPQWVRTPIDAFVLSRLDKEGLRPSGSATRERLIRRITLDLTGLPPTLAEIDAFLADQRPGAYERVVDRLLASPRFGERMTVAWMDLARYGDSSVFHADGPRDMWPWRDWVINAYNSNKSFRDFTIEQLAGDLLPGSTVAQQIATGFHRNNATTDEGGAIAEEFRVEYAVDRVKTTALVWLGLSLECAQCHDHKYDPITQREYYRVFAYFNQASDPGMQTRRGNQKPVVSVPNPVLSAQLAKIRLELRRTQQQLKARRSLKTVQQQFRSWLASAKATRQSQSPIPSEPSLHITLDQSKGRQVVARGTRVKGRIRGGKPDWRSAKIGGGLQFNGKTFVDFGRKVGVLERSDSFSFGGWVRPGGRLQGALLSKMNNGNRFRGYDLLFSGGHLEVHLVHQWPNNAIKVRTVKSVLKPNQWQHIMATYDGSSKAGGLKIYVNGKPQALSVQQNRLSKTIKANIEFVLGRRRQNPSSYVGLMDDVRIYRRTLTANQVAALAGQDPIGPLLRIAAGKRTKSQEKQLLDYYLANKDKVYIELTRQQRQLQLAQSQNSKPVSTVMIMKDVPNYRMTYVLTRGNYASPDRKQPVRPGTPSIFPPPAEKSANRLGLANWLMQPNHPLTARVTVNRYWAMFFGNGLVRTLEDFGAQGETPSHPALLDYLAVDFVESGWNIKRMLKQIVMSATYRQSSRITREILQRDPDNRLLARGARFRMAGEFIRDSALATSGLLVSTIGGRSVKPYQPPGLWNEVSLSGGVRFRQDKGAKLYRRSMYTYWKRSAPAPGLTIFDTPSREKCVIRRSHTNTPLQALVVLNDPQFVEAARRLAGRVMGETSVLEGQVERMYRRLTGVKPGSSTVQLLCQAYRRELQVFRATPERARQLLSVGDSQRNMKLDAPRHAALTIIASIILNLDASLTRG